ncbi:MAG TPA: zf-HC2 domain-containing protein [Blastocatellia bacterium]|nr:zf-HC2 domain-containing protein [Blastocatellia bacterium]
MTGWDENEGHSAEGTLLRYLDGELSPNEAALVQAHLAACWSCRRNAERLQEAVFAFIEYRDQVWRPSTTPPPSSEQKFEGRLHELRDRLGDRSWLARLRGSWNRGISVSRLAASPRPLVWTAAGMIGALAAVAFFTWLDRGPVVTASELLRRASEAQASELRAREEPVIYQKLRIKRGERTATWELWRDTANARFRQSIESAKELRGAQADETALLTELTEVLHANRMNPQQPLSPASFQVWRRSLAAKREEVSRLQTDAGEMLRLRVLPLAEPSAGQIAEASLMVRARDWHPLAQTLKVQGENETRDYELKETAYEVVPLAALTVFAEPSPSPSPAATIGRISPAASPAALTPAPTLKLLPTAAELQEAEIAALYLLHQLKADLGEQLEVVRESGEQIVVRGQVETPERKRELMATIKEIPWVEARIQTFDEAAGPPSPIAGPAPAVTSPEPNLSAAPAAGVNHFEERLAGYFAERAAPAQKNRAAIDRRITQFANSVFAESSAALANGWALRRLAERFNENGDEQLSATSAGRIREIIGDHLSEIRARNRNLRAQLEPALVAIGGTGTEAAPSPRPAEGTRRARIMRLFESIEQTHQTAYRLFDSKYPYTVSPEQAASLMLGALAQLEAASQALEQDIRKQ